MITCLEDYSTYMFNIAYGNTITTKIEAVDDETYTGGYRIDIHRTPIQRFKGTNKALQTTFYY